MSTSWTSLLSRIPILLAKMRCPGMLFLLAPAAHAQDWQIWPEVDFSRTISDRWHITAPLVLRDSFNLKNPQLFGGGAILDFRATAHLQWSAGYLYVGLPNTGPGFHANVPLTAVTFRDRFGIFALSDRNRLERLYGLPGSPIRFRNKIEAIVPIRDGRWSPFISSEIFYDFTQRTWTQNRFQVGVGTRMSERLRLAAYYLERTDLQTRTGDVHAIGLTFEIDLDDMLKGTNRGI